MPRNEADERWLGQQKVNFRYVGPIQLSSFNLAAGSLKQARMTEQLDGDLIERYVVAMQHGDVLPPVIAYQDADGRYVPVAGNHRLAAAKSAGLATFEAYEVMDVSPQVLERITRIHNFTNGKPPLKDEAVSQAIELINLYSYDVKSIAPMVGLKASTLEAAIRDRKVSERLQGLGVKPETLGVRHRRTLFGIASDPVLRRAAEAQRQAGLTDAELRSLVQEVKHGRSEAEQLQAVTDFSNRPDVRDRIAASAGGQLKASKTPYEKALAASTNLRAHFEKRGGLGEGASLEGIERFESEFSATQAIVRRGIAEARRTAIARGIPPPASRAAQG